MTINKTIIYLFLGAVLVIGIVGYLEYNKLERELKKQRQDYVIQKEKLIEKNTIAFDSIDELNKEINRLIAKSQINIEDANVRRNQNKQDYEQAVNDADTISDVSFLQRTLSGIFERN